MARQKKNIINQIFEEPINEIIETEQENIEDTLLSPIPEVVIDEPVKEIVLKEVKPRTIESLSHKELRLFQRTGQMPK